MSSNAERECTAAEDAFNCAVAVHCGIDDRDLDPEKFSEDAVTALEHAVRHLQDALEEIEARQADTDPITVYSSGNVEDSGEWERLANAARACLNLDVQYTVEGGVHQLDLHPADWDALTEQRVQDFAEGFRAALAHDWRAE